MIGYSLRYNGLRINDTQEIRDFKNNIRSWCITCTNVETDVEIRHTERPFSGNHGIFDSDSYLGKRTFTLEGDIMADSEESVREAVNELKKAFTLPAFYDINTTGYHEFFMMPQDPVKSGEGFPLTFPIELLGDEEENGFICDAKVFAPVRITKIFKMQNRRKFFIQLKSKDPRIYSKKLYETYLLKEWSGLGFKLPLNMSVYGASFGFVFQPYSSDGIETIENIGNFSIAPKIRILGECNNPVITNLTSGVEMKFNINLAVGEYIDVDVFNQNITDQNGNNKISILDIDSRWIWFQTGENQLLFSDDIVSTEIGQTKVIINYRQANV